MTAGAAPHAFPCASPNPSGEQMANIVCCFVVARRSDDSNPLTESELAELRRNLSLLSGPSVVDFYRDAYRDCAVERKPGAKAIQRLVTAWKILRKWGWR